MNYGAPFYFVAGDRPFCGINLPISRQIAPAESAAMLDLAQLTRVRCVLLYSGGRARRVSSTV